MEYKFNKDYFSQLCAERGLTNVALQNALNMTNTTPINRWRGGEDIRSEHIVRICNAFNVNPAKFFLCNGQPIALSDDVKQISYISEKETSSIINQYQDQIAFLHDKLEFEKYRSMSFKEEVEYKQRELDETRNELKKYKDEVMELRKQLLATTTNV